MLNHINQSAHVKDKNQRYRDLDDELLMRLYDSISRFKSVDNIGQYQERIKPDQHMIEREYFQEAKRQASMPMFQGDYLPTNLIEE